MGTRKRFKTTLLEGKIFTIEGVGFLKVKCIRGNVWVTTGDGRETQLLTGIERALTPGGVVALEGLPEALVEVSWR